MEALQRSGSVFNQFGASTKTAIATISALATTTARSGSTIGNSWKSILSNIEKDKVKAAFDELGISIYAIGENGEKVQKNLDVLFGEIMQKWTSFDQETRNRFARSWAGTYQLNALSAFMNDAMPVYQKLMDDMGKANNSLTTKLLAEGLDTYAQKLEQLSAAWDVFAVSLGDKALPALKDTVLGLTEGLQWLTKNKEELSDLIGYLGQAIYALVAYKGAQAFWNIAVAEGVTLGTMFAARMGSVEAQSRLAAVGIGTFTTGIWSLVSSLIAVAGRMVIFLALAEGISRISAGASADVDEREFLQSVEAKQSGIAGAKGISSDEQEILEKINKRREFAEANAIAHVEESWMTGEGYVFSNRDDQKQFDKLDEDVRNAIHKQKLKKDLDDFSQKFGDLSKVKLGEHEKTVGTTNIPGLGGKPKGSKDGSGSSAPDSTEQRKRIEIQAEYKRIMADMTVAANRYSEVLDDLNTKESIYGQTVAITNEKYDLMTKRIREMTDEQSKLTTERDKYQGQLEEYLAKDQEFQQVAASTIAGWSGMSKGERKSYLVTNREGVQEFKTLKTLLDIISELDVKISETSRNTSKLQNQWDKDFLGDTLNVDRQRERTLRNIGLDESTALAQVNKRNPLYQWDEDAVALAAERQRYQQYVEYARQLENERQKLIESLPEQIKYIQARIDQANALADSAEKTEILKMLTDELTAAQNGNTAALQNNTDKQKQNNDAKVKSEEKQREQAEKTSQNIKKLWADSFVDMAQNGASFRDVMKNIWNDIQKDAIYSLLKIKHNASASSEMFGKGKSGASNVSSPSAGKKGIGKAANGAIVNVPTIAGEDGEETIIPTEKNTQNSKKLLDYASNKLGYYPGANTYAPYFKDSSLATQPVVNVQLQQQQNHIQELERQTQVMSAMLNHMMNNPGGNTTVVPIVTQVSSEQILEVLQKNPEALSNIMGRHKANGWR